MSRPPAITIGEEAWTSTAIVERDTDGNIVKTVTDWRRHEPDPQVAQLQRKAQLSAELRLEQQLEPMVTKLSRTLSTIDRAVDTIAEHADAEHVALSEATGPWVPGWPSCTGRGARPTTRRCRRSRVT